MVQVIQRKMIVRFLFLTLLSQAQKATECKKQETLCNCIARGCSNGEFIDNQIIIVSEGTVTYKLSFINANCSSIAPICKSLVHFSIEPKKVHCKQVISNSGFFPLQDESPKKKSSGKLWPKKDDLVIIPYRFDGKHTAEAEELIESAIQEVHSWVPHCIWFLKFDSR